MEFSHPNGNLACKYKPRNLHLNKKIPTLQWKSSHSNGNPRIPMEILALLTNRVPSSISIIRCTYQKVSNVAPLHFFSKQRNFLITPIVNILFSGSNCWGALVAFVTNLVLHHQILFYN